MDCTGYCKPQGFSTASCLDEEDQKVLGGRFNILTSTYGTCMYVKQLCAKATFLDMIIISRGCNITHACPDGVLIAV